MLLRSRRLTSHLRVWWGHNLTIFGNVGHLTSIREMEPPGNVPKMKVPDTFILQPSFFIPCTFNIHLPQICATIAS